MHGDTELLYRQRFRHFTTAFRLPRQEYSMKPFRFPMIFSVFLRGDWEPTPPPGTATLPEREGKEFQRKSCGGDEGPNLYLLPFREE